MFLPWTRIATVVASAAIVVLPNTSLQSKVTPTTDVAENWDNQTVSNRLATLQLPVSVQANEQVLARIQQYLTTGKVETEAILGRATLYFPIFEHQLRVHGLPESLKYLPVIESGLLSTIKSPAGATGIWQFMSISAKHFGLQIGNGIDERMDIYRSTEAAVKMLKILYDEFGDWALVLAAYNSGEGKVNQAVRMAGTKDYWKVKDFLPKETQRYVPAFIAAAYVSKYHRQHNLQPSNAMAALASDLRALRVYRRLSFGEISRVTGISLTTLGQLNPAFVQGIIPSNEAGHFVMLPNEKATLLLREYLNEASEQKITSNAFRTTYVVSKGDNLEQVAKLFQASPEDIKKWNSLHSDELVVRQELVLYLPKSFLFNRA